MALLFAAASVWNITPDKTMKDTPYAKFCSNKLILRDELAIDRTLLANERTLLAYLRSAVALVIAGVSMMEFSTAEWFWILGLACIPIGIIVGIIGVARYRRMNESIILVRNQSEADIEASPEDAAPPAPTRK